MHREIDSRGRFITRGISSIPTTPPTPPRARKGTPPSQTHTPSHRTPGILGVEIQSKESPTTGIAFFTSIEEPIVVKELGILGEEEEVEPLSHSPLIEEPEEEGKTL